MGHCGISKWVAIIHWLVQGTHPEHLHRLMARPFKPRDSVGLYGKRTRMAYPGAGGKVCLGVLAAYSSGPCFVSGLEFLRVEHAAGDALGVAAALDAVGVFLGSGCGERS